MDVSKRTLGVSYLVATGTVLAGLVLGAGLTGSGADVGVRLGILAGVIPSASLASARYWLERSRLNDEQVWTVAKWGGLGIAVLTLLDLAVIVAHSTVAPLSEPGLAVLASNVAVGGVVGILVGGIREHHRRTRVLSEKNAVLNRVLRHDLRNAAGIIRANAELLEEDAPEHGERIGAVKAKADELVDLSETARRLERTLDREEFARRAVDLAAVTREAANRVRRDHPEATVEVEAPAEAWVYADDLLGSVVENVMENAVEHNDGPAEVRVSIGHHGMPVGGRTTLRVEDNGPGIPESELAVLAEGQESPLAHTSGTGLWLVRWLVDHYGGRMSFENGGEGSVVTVELRRSLARRKPAPSVDDAASADGPWPGMDAF